MVTVSATSSARDYIEEQSHTAGGQAVQQICKKCFGNDYSCGVCRLNQFLRSMVLYDEGLPIEKAAEQAELEASVNLRSTTDKYDRENGPVVGDRIRYY